jgi:hypothetical protein
MPSPDHSGTPATQAPQVVSSNRFVARFSPRPHPRHGQPPRKTARRPASAAAGVDRAHGAVRYRLPPTHARGHAPANTRKATRTTTTKTPRSLPTHAPPPTYTTSTASNRTAHRLRRHRRIHTRDTATRPRHRLATMHRTPHTPLPRALASTPILSTLRFCRTPFRPSRTTSTKAMHEGPFGATNAEPGPSPTVAASRSRTGRSTGPTYPTARPGFSYAQS